MRPPTIRRPHCVTMHRMETKVGCSLCWMCDNLSARFHLGQSENASTYSAIRLTMGTIISKPSQPEKPALAKIFQNGSTITTAPSNIVSQWAPNHHAISFIYVPFVMIGNLYLIVLMWVSLVPVAAAVR